MKNAAFVLLCAMLAAGCDSPFDVGHGAAAQVVIVLYDGLPIQVGHTLTAALPDLNDTQISEMDIRYTWYRDNEAVALRTGDEHPNSDTDATYTVKAEDLRTSIKVQAVFKYNNSVSDAIVDIDASTVGSFAELQALLASAGKVNAQTLITTGDFVITSAVSIPANTSLTINTAVTADANITVRGKIFAEAGSLTVNPAKNIALMSGGTFTVNSGGNVYLGGTLDNTSGTVANNGTITVEGGGVVTAIPVWQADDTGKYIVNQGGRISGLTGSGGVIDNFTGDNVTTVTRNGMNLISGGITVLDDWAISDTLTINSGCAVYLEGKTLTVNAGGNIYLDGIFDNSSGVVANNGTITVESNGVLAAIPVWQAGDAGKYIVKQGGEVSGFIGTGGVIDNYTAANEITLARNGFELMSGSVNVIDDWVLSGTLTINSGCDIYLDAALDSSSGTVANNGTITVESNGVLAAIPVWQAGDAGKYIVKQGGEVSGFIGSGGVIDNYTAVNEIALARNGFELMSGSVNVVDDWVLSGTLTINSGCDIYLDAVLDNSSGTVANNGTITVESNGTLAAIPVWQKGDAGKYIVKQGGEVSGFIGIGGVIDNYTAANEIALARNGFELMSGSINVVDDWVLSGTFTINPGCDIYLDAALDNSSGTVANNGTITVNNGGALAAIPVWQAGDAGKYTVKQGGEVSGFIGTGGVIDNYTAVNEIALARNGFELVSGSVNVVDDWTISDTLTVNGNIIIDSGKDIKGNGAEANPDYRIVVKPASSVSGGTDNLNLVEGTYIWDGSAWVSEDSPAVPNRG